ncbi:MAG TPA: triple tyrosine motif-containing protein, partial [Cyclobacteriaceae bacterium]|nr:triple tyrosine motif-containing protein [Cyclobacteriaceae bacterium]
LFTTPSRAASENRILDILIDRKKRLWMATYQGLWRFSLDKKNFERIELWGREPDANELVSALNEGRDGRIWIGHWSLGLKWYDPESRRSKEVVGPGLPSDIRGIATVRNPQGEFDVWCANLVRINEKGLATQYITRVNPPTINYHVTKLYSSNDGLLWLCSDKGALIMDPLKQFFYNYQFSQSITHQGISFLQKEKSIYVGGAGSHFFKCYDSAFRLQRSYTLSKKLFPKMAPALLSIVREDSGHVWLCTEDGLVLLDEGNGQQQLFRLSKEECPVATRNFISTLFIDRNGNHWLFPWRGGIWHFDKSKQKFTRRIEGLTVDKGVRKGLLVTAAAEDNLGNIWFADLDEGLIRFDRSKNIFSKPTEKYVRAGYNLTNVAYERPYIWAVTSGLVFRIHERTLTCERWPIPDELNKTVTGFLTDKQSHLWITTRSGLLSFDKATGQFKHFTVNDGLIDNMMTGSMFCLANGKIVYGDESYFTVFDPRELVKPSSVPPVLITGAFSQNRSIQMQTDGDGKKIADLDHTYNDFTFNWAVIHYSNPLQNRYYCKLEGVDPDWKYIGNTGRVQYASLSPGRYVFRARGATSDGIMNEQGDEVIIIIHPPFWKSSWFFFTCGLVFLGLTYSWYRYRLNEALRTERLRNKISADLHDEIGSTLSSISIMSDLVAQKTIESRTSEVANEIRENAIVLMERMDDIVWSINPRNDSLENLLLRVRRFAGQLFEARNIDYEIEISPDVKQVKMPMEFRQNIYLILKESINNLVKHSKATRASIEVMQNHSFLSVTIRDNGIGFSAREKPAGNGIASMKSRASEMRVKLSIDSENGSGTVVKLILKIK